MSTSYAFLLPALLRIEGKTLTGRAVVWADRTHELEAELLDLQHEIDELCFGLYGFLEEDRRAITEGFGEVGDPSEMHDGVDEETDEEDRARLEDDADVPSLTSELLSWCVGVGFGRFDVRLATGESELLPEPEPFDPLPVCSPGMFTGEDGLPVDAPPVGYQIAWPVDGLLVDDPGHPRDLTSAVRGVFDVVFGADADAFWVEAAELLDPRSRDIQRWLAKSFFPEHIRRYSKSRRKAPIYWQLGTPSGSYSVWLYAHRIGRDSLYQVLNDLVAPKLAAEERKLTALVQETGPTPTAGQRKELAGQETFVEELRVLRDEVACVAPVWNPDLNDGVVIVMAPLWRLVPQHKPWRKELKAHWDALCAGKYDWAQLAMHLWPERVVPKCVEDRSLATAHALEDVFWAEDADGKWTARDVDQAEIDRLVAERTSPAVNDGLANLTAAPASTAGRPTSGEVVA